MCDDVVPHFHMEKRRSSAGTGRDSSDQTISRQFDWRETLPSIAVVRLLSVAMNCEPTAIDPLGERIDTDALDRLLLSMDDRSKLEFTHLGLSIHLYGDGTATVELEGC